MLRLELSGLADAQRQIEETKQVAANVATELALRQENLDLVSSELKFEEDKINGHKGELTRLIKEIETRKIELGLLPEGLKGKIDELRAVISTLEGSKTILEDGLQVLRNERSLLLAERAEFAEIVARKTILAAEIERLSGEAKNMRTELSEMELEDAAQAVKLANLRQELFETTRSLSAGRDEIQSLAARKEVLKQELDKLRTQTGSGTGNSEDVIADLKTLPMPLQTSFISERAPQNEADALGAVGDYLAELQLSYDRRTIAAFHTALKINDNAQLTVLAGVSGTGKSLLPRRYAEAMGIRFLPIAVEPRWDSPQDLLGFYNYIEKRFRATDLARSLVHMDMYNTSELSDGKFKDQLMLVLLDEMNLARVEYYFSEFLSRLEARPVWLSADDEHKRRDSYIPIDIRGRSNGTIKLFPPHNMLFVGTMNDDESTQSLSDKVLDRSNIMQFSAPDRFRDQHIARPEQQIASSFFSRKEYLSFARWRRWVKTTDQLHGAERSKADDVIKELAEIMESCGRPFGHRLNAAMLNYAANYPSERHQGDKLEWAMVDQIEFRILPKLRGLQIDDHGGVFERLEKLISEKLSDSQFARRLRSLAEQQRTAGGLFNWRGYTRNTDWLKT